VGIVGKCKFGVKEEWGKGVAGGAWGRRGLGGGEKKRKKKKKKNEGSR